MSAPHTYSPAPGPSHASNLMGQARLSDWGVIQAEGPDAASFLQGQLTNDVQGLSVKQARLAGYCSAKGRLQGSFVVWRPSPERFLLACSADLLAPLLKRLSLFVLRAKCKLSDVSQALPLWGLAMPVAETELAPALQTLGRAWERAELNEASSAIRLPDAALPPLAPASRTPESAPPLEVPLGGLAATAGTHRLYLVCGQPLEQLPDLPISGWQAVEAASGVLRIQAATVEQFVPQMVNLELVHGVDFKKGCYPGQEVVARSQYRGTLKRRGFLVQSPAPLSAGQEIFHSADPGQPAGMVAMAGSHAGQHLGFAELKLAAAHDAQGQLCAGSAEGPVLQVAALPYAVGVAQ